MSDTRSDSEHLIDIWRKRAFVAECSLDCRTKELAAARAFIAELQVRIADVERAYTQEQIARAHLRERIEKLLVLF